MDTAKIPVRKEEMEEIQLASYGSAHAENQLIYIEGETNNA
ncbi:hypothetical protein ACW0TQ_20660 [Oceanobacillus sp. M60]